MKANSWLYHYYMVQSRLQYSLAYGGQSPTSLAAFYPGMQGSGNGFSPGQSPFDFSASAFMPPPPHSSGHTPYAGYAGYTPPPGAYNLQQHYGGHAPSSQGHASIGERSSESPLDFSTAANQYNGGTATGGGGGGGAWHPNGYEENEKAHAFSEVRGGSNGIDRASSPQDYR